MIGVVVEDLLERHLSAIDSWYEPLGSPDMARKGDKTFETPKSKRGLYRAYDKQGTVVWECEDFEPGKSKVPFGISFAMAASQIVDAKGEVIHRWDPSKMLPER